MLPSSRAAVVATTFFVMARLLRWSVASSSCVLGSNVPGLLEERGLAAWAALTEDDSEYVSALDRIRGRGGDRPSAVSDD